MIMKAETAHIYRDYYSNSMNIDP